MKKLIFLFIFSVYAINAQAQFIFKTVPKNFYTVKNDTITVTGIKCRFVGNIDLTLQDDTLYHRTFYISFVTSLGQEVNAFNTTSAEIAEDMIKSGATPGNAMSQMNTIIRDLELGTRTQKYSKAQLLAAKYGYALLPLNQQE